MKMTPHSIQTAGLSSPYATPDSLVADQPFPPYYGDDLRIVNDSLMSQKESYPGPNNDAGYFPDRVIPQEVAWSQLSRGLTDQVTVTSAPSFHLSQTPASLDPSKLTAAQSNPFLTSVDQRPDFLASRTGINVDECQQSRQCLEGHLGPFKPTSVTTALQQPMLSTAKTPRVRSAPDDHNNTLGPPAKLQRTITDPTNDTSNGAKAGKDSKPHSTSRVPHNLVERRYRDNLNSQIESLRRCVPSLKDAYQCSDKVEINCSPLKAPSKAVIISTAASYIMELENETSRLLGTTRALQDQVAGLQKLFRCDDCSALKNITNLHVHPMQVSPTQMEPTQLYPTQLYPMEMPTYLHAVRA